MELRELGADRGGEPVVLIHGIAAALALPAEDPWQVRRWAPFARPGRRPS